MGYKDMTYRDWYDFDPKDAEIDRLRAELERMRSSAIYWQDRCGALEHTLDSDKEPDHE